MNEVVKLISWQELSLQLAEEKGKTAALRALLQEAGEALKPFAHPDLLKAKPGAEHNESIIYQRNDAEMLLGDFRRAAEVAAKIQEALA